MSTFLEVCLVVVLLIDLALLGTVRSRLGVRALSLQGIAVGLVPLLIGGQGEAWRLWVLVILSVLLKAVVFPRLLLRALREAPVTDESAPLVGPTPSLFIGVGLLALAFGLGHRLAPPAEQASPMVFPVGLYTMLAGLYLICTRNRALTQVLGYLVLENGVFLFGQAVARESPLLIEMGALLDVMLAVLVMGAAIFHINRTFDSTDVDRLTALKG
jgi:hydrogenase-4 component E